MRSSRSPRARSRRGDASRLGAPITQGGTNVSGGQRQRLAIARAIVRRPEIYLFDDSFSALDFKTDSLLRAALPRGDPIGDRDHRRPAGRTILHADRIVVMDAGEIVGVGTHRELLETCETYREIVFSQDSARRRSRERPRPGRPRRRFGRRPVAARRPVGLPAGGPPRGPMMGGPGRGPGGMSAAGCFPAAKPQDFRGHVPPARRRAPPRAGEGHRRHRPGGVQRDRRRDRPEAPRQRDRTSSSRARSATSSASSSRRARARPRSRSCSGPTVRASWPTCCRG